MSWLPGRGERKIDWWWMDWHEVMTLGMTALKTESLMFGRYWRRLSPVAVFGLDWDSPPLGLLGYLLKWTMDLKWTVDLNWQTGWYTACNQARNQFRHDT